MENRLIRALFPTGDDSPTDGMRQELARLQERNHELEAQLRDAEEELFRLRQVSAERCEEKPEATPSSVAPPASPASHEEESLPELRRKKALSRDMLVGIAPDGSIRFANAASVSLFSPSAPPRASTGGATSTAPLDSLSLSPAGNTIHDARNSTLRRAFALFMRTGESTPLFTKHEGRQMECRAFPVDLEGVPHVVLALFDITERDHARRLLLQVQGVLEKRIATRNAALRQQMRERRRAEHALRYQLEVVRQVVDIDPSPICVLDEQNTPHLVNGAFSTLFDMTVEEVTPALFLPGGAAWNFIAPCVEAVRHSGSSAQMERSITDGRGIPRWFDVVGTPIPLPHGSRAVLCIAANVTDRKISQLTLEEAHSKLEKRVKERTAALAEVNEELRREAVERRVAQQRIIESEARFRGLFFSNQAIKLLVDTETMTVAEANDAALHFYGYERNEFVGQHVSLFSLTSTDLTHLRILRLGASGSTRFESRHRKKGGSAVDMEIYAGIIMDKNRRTLLATIHDISERKHAERLVVEQSNHLTALMNALGDSALLLDRYGRIITLNRAAAETLGGGEDQLAGKVAFDLMSPIHSGPKQRIFGEALTTGQPVREELWVSDSVWDITCYPVLDAGQRCTGVALYCKDITSRKQAEEHMRWLSARVLSAQEEERKRIGRELHDSTAQTLSGIKFMMEAELARMDKAHLAYDTGTIHKTISLLREAIVELRRIIMDLRPTVLDDLGLLAALRWLQSEFPTQHGMNFRLWLDMDEQCLDEMQKSVLFRVAQEATANVARHSNADALSLSLERQDNTCLLTITDNGAGFDVNTAGPSGIGLDSMRERLELVDGELRIVSEPGKGTQIQAVVPLPEHCERRQSVRPSLPQGED